MKSKVITLKAKDHDKAGLSQYPNAGPCPSIFGMRKLYGYGENEHTIIRCGYTRDFAKGGNVKCL